MNDMIWHEWHDLTWMTRFDMNNIIWHDSTWFDINDMICHEWHDLTWFTWFDITQHDFTLMTLVT
jgi:hypothetical protein